MKRVAFNISRRNFSSSSFANREAVIISAKRTPVGSFNGSLASLSAPQLGAEAIKGALNDVPEGVRDGVGEVFMGNVVSANLGQAPARQAAIFGGIGQNVGCTTINKVCASGMKAVMLAASQVMLGLQDCVVAGGMESMSNVPYYLPNGRGGHRYGHGQVLDGIVKDGLTDVYDNHLMGMCAENIADVMNFSREEQDAYAIQSYERSASAWGQNAFANEITPVTIKGKRGKPDVEVNEDEEYKRIDLAKVGAQRPAFKKDGSVTAANSSTLNDGATALIVTSREFADKVGAKPLAKILGFADAATKPIDFTIAPALAAPKALENAGVAAEKVDLWEINEAFAVVALANQKLLNIDSGKLNVNGGGVSLGHPIGNSGARILASLTHMLHNQDKEIGCAAICNGGGGASAIVIQRE